MTDRTAASRRRHGQDSSVLPVWNSHPLRSAWALVLNPAFRFPFATTLENEPAVLHHATFTDVAVLGLEAVAAFALGITVLNENTSWTKLCALVLIVSGIALLERL